MTTLLFHLRGLLALLAFLYGFTSPLVLGGMGIILIGYFVVTV